MRGPPCLGEYQSAEAAGGNRPNAVWERIMVSMAQLPLIMVDQLGLQWTRLMDEQTVQTYCE